MKKVVITLVLVLIIFVSTCKQADKLQTNLSNEIAVELRTVALDMEEKIEGALDAARDAGVKAQEIFDEKKGYGAVQLNKNIYYRGRTGTLSDHGHKTESNVNVYRTVRENDFIKWYISATEDLVDVWKENYTKYPYIGWQYILDIRYHALRIFPWIETTLSFSPNINWPEMGFYKCVTPEHNPDRLLKWSRIDTDILGLGLISSPSIPIYIDDKFVAISAIDFLITKTFKDYLYKKYHGKNSYLMLIHKPTTQILLRNKRNKGERSWDNMFEFAYLDQYVKENPEFKEGLEQILYSEEGMITAMLPDKKQIYFKKLKNVDWVVAIVTETSNDG